MNTTDHSHVPDPELPVVLLTPRRFRTWDLIGAGLAWLLILGIVCFKLFAPQSVASNEAANEGHDINFDLQARYTVAAAQMQGGTNNQSLLNQLSATGAGSPERRLREAVLAGELAGPSAALQRLPGDWNNHSNEIEDILFRLYTDYQNKHWNAPSVTPAEKQTLRQQLGWYGDLALAPEEGPDHDARKAALAPAWCTLIVALSAFVGGLALLAAGTLGLVILFVAWLLGKIRGAMTTGTGRSAIWVQTFALYMLLYVGMSVVMSLLGFSTVTRMKMSGPLALLSLVALFWPRIRGFSWTEIRREIGWTSGRGLGREIIAGPATYAMALPFAAIGVVVMLLLTVLSRMWSAGPPPDSPVHPVVPILPGAGLELKLILLLFAAVIAPIVEETMFRGVLYRHLRESTHRFGGVLGFIASALLTSFIFAAIHPQGWRGIPPLMGIALGLTIAREWRGSLIPSMIAHGINNGVLMAILLVALGS